MKLNWLERAAVQTPYMVLCTDEKAFSAACGHMKIVPEDVPGKWINDDCDGTTHSFWKDDAAPACVVCVRKDEKASLCEIAGLLTHEAVHVYATMKTINKGMPWEDEELAAVCISHIFQQLMQDYLLQMGRTDKLPRRMPAKGLRKKETT